MQVKALAAVGAGDIQRRDACDNLDPCKPCVKLVSSLAWFVLSLGVAVASPLVKPQGLELVCASGGALKLVVTDDIGVQAETGQTGAMNLLGHTLDCPLCANLGAPPQVIGAALAPVPGLSSALHPIAATHIPGRTAAPMFARGPPARA